MKKASANPQRFSVLTREQALIIQCTMIMAIAVVLRVIFLDTKPVHFDEGINGWFVSQMWGDGFYRYDPQNYHGPLYFYYLLLAELLLGRGIETMRFATGLVAAGTVLVVLLHARWFGRAALWAGLLVAISPAMVFYGRYAIHESMLVLMQAVFIYGFFRWRFEGGRTAVILMVAGVAGSIATKETSIIFLGTWLIAMAAVAIAGRLDKMLSAASSLAWLMRVQQRLAFAQIAPMTRASVSGKFVAIVMLMGVAALLILFSGFFMNSAGVPDMLRSYLLWTETGTAASGHDKPFPYWLQLFARYEIPTLVGLVCLPLLLIVKEPWVRQLALVGLGVVLAYSIIPYKTPWLIIGLIMPLSFVFGFALDALQKLFPSQHWPLLMVAALGLMAATLLTTVRLNYRDYADFSEPYVYVQSSANVSELTDTIEALVSLSPHQRNMDILVLNRDTWPLPWVLGRYPGLGYGTVDGVTAVSADVILVDAGGETTLEALMTEPYYRRPFQIRDGNTNGWAYFRRASFDPVLRALDETAEDSTLTIVP